MFRRNSSQDNDEDLQPADSTYGTTGRGQNNLEEELALVQRQVNELTAAVHNKEKEIEDLRDVNKREQGAFSQLKLQLDNIERSMRDVTKDSDPKSVKPSRVTLARGDTKRFARARRKVGDDVGGGEGGGEEEKEEIQGSEDFLPQRSPLISSVQNEPTSVSQDPRLVQSAVEKSSKPMRKSLFASLVDWKDSLFDGGEDEEEVDEPNFIAFDEDTFSLMMVSPVFSRYWVLGVAAATFQWTVLILILLDLATASAEGSPLSIPYSVPFEVTVGQFLGIFICVGVQTDVLSSVRLLIAMRNTEETIWDEVIGVSEEQRTWKTWLIRVFLPNIVKFLSGILVLSVNFITIVQSSNIVDLMKDVAALLIISEITEIFFKLAEFGFLGNRFEDRAKLVLETEVEDNLITSVKPIFGVTIPARLVVFIVLVGIMSGFVSFFIQGQLSGLYFNDTYPYCDITVKEIKLIGDGVCEGGIFNTIACDFDGGDCVSFNLQYPNCKAPEPKKIGDNICNEEYNIPECGFDGNDCCPFATENFTDPRFGDKMCDGGKFFATLCKLDNFDCLDFTKNAPSCDNEELSDLVPFGEEPRLGDGICDSKIYNTPECLFENGDCDKCNAKVIDYTLIGDGVCQGGPYNTLDCNYDATDCISFNKRWPRCEEKAKDKIVDNMVAFPIIGDGICNSGLYNNEDCGYEDGDCLFCNELVPDITKVGDGFCDGQQYMSDVCGYDGGDCIGCEAPRFEIGNGWCTPEYNTKECSYDGGDCNAFLNYTACEVEFPSLLGNGHCNGEEYNTEECGWDGGDCLEIKLEGCDEPQRRHYLLENGRCEGFLNNEECEFDKGDCTSFNEDYPACDFDGLDPELVGDGVCNGGNYNTESCKWDGGDCLVEL